MSLTFAILGIIVLALVLLAQLIRLGRSTSAASQEALEKELSNPRKYDVLARLFGEDDAHFISSLNGLSPERRRVLSVFLRDMWGDFHRAWTVCKLLAPLSDDPEFGAQLVRQRASFYLIYTLVRFRFALGSSHSFNEDIQTLANTVRGLRDSAQQLVQSTHLELPQSANGLGVGPTG